MNVELLEKVKQHILEEPRRYNQQHWIGVGETEIRKRFGKVGDLPPCGTMACIAGWTCILAGVDLKGVDLFSISDKAEELLGINCIQADRLFSSVAEDALVDEEMDEDEYQEYFSGDWPYGFAKDYVLAKTAEDRAKVAVARIDHFIATDGKE
jgi:hypothetical protein